MDHIHKKLDSVHPIKRKGCYMEKRIDDTVDAELSVFTMDKNGIIISANESMSQMSGYNLQDLIGKDYKILLHPDIVKTVWKDVVNTVANGQCWFGYLKKMARDGHSYWAHMAITPLHSKVTFQSICRKAYNEEIKVLNLAM